MDYYVNTTSFINPIISSYVAPFQPRTSNQRKAERKALTDRTAFITTGGGSVDFFAAVTGPLAPTSSPLSQLETDIESTPTLAESIHAQTTAAVVPQLSAEIDQIAKQRVQLMAAKYASGVQSTEIVARLEILNSRLSERAPRVSKAQVAALEVANDQLARIRASREERAKRLGMPAEL